MEGKGWIIGSGVVVIACMWLDVGASAAETFFYEP